MYWNPGFQNMQGQMQQPPQMAPQMMPQMAPQMVPPTTIPLNVRGVAEQSFIENILRLNTDMLGTFYFSFERAVTAAGTNVKRITGYVQQAGRDHVIIKEKSTGHSFLMPMIYFDFAEFQDGINYLPQRPR